MSDPCVLYHFWCQAWVAHIDPPWFLNSTILEFNGEGGRIS
jgi:hypothetical protein